MQKTRRNARVILLATLAMLMLLLSGCAPEAPAGQGIFVGGAFDEQGIWVGQSEEYSELIAGVRKQCDRFAVGSVMLATDDQVLLAGGWNATETDGETTVDAYTTYEVGSLTKQFTAACILQQVEQGKLNVSETIDKYFPQLPFGGQVTIDHLLHMDSGIYDSLNNARLLFSWDNDAIDSFLAGTMSDEELLDYLSKTPLFFEPGSKYSYSNTNYYLLALILEQVTGKTYEEYVQENIFDVCGMNDSSCCEVEKVTSVPAKEYMATARCVRGAGDIHSSVHDMLLWDRALFGGRILSEEQLAYMTELRNGYSCGWTESEPGVLFHGGRTFSYETQTVVATTDKGERIYLIGMCSDLATAHQFQLMTDPLLDFVGA